MPGTIRIGARIGSADPYWVQLREAVLHRSQQLEVELVSIDFGSTMLLSGADQLMQLEELRAQNLDALVCSYLPEEVTAALLAHGTPVVQLTEAELRHPLFVSTRGYYDIANMLGRHLAERIGRGHVLIVGGLLAPRGEDGRSRLAGIDDALIGYPCITSEHIPSAWRYEHAYKQILAAMRRYSAPLDAILGLSDSLALAARDAGRELGLLDAHTVIVGINGDPLALAAVADGSMAATVDTSAADLGTEAVNLAFAAAGRRKVPPYLRYTPQLVTSENVAAVAMQKLIAIAELPSRLVGVNRRQEQQRLSQLELSRAINRRAGSILDRRQLGAEIAELIRTGYAYDSVQLFRWLEPEQALLLETPAGPSTPLPASGVLAQAVQQNQLIFLPDARDNHRFAPDPLWPFTRSRVVAPIRFGGTLLGLLDLHSRGTIQHTAHSLANLQLLADELGIALRNADLYSEALRAQAQAEQADRLKTRLLANVSHELRTPLNVILGYSQAALATPNPYGAGLPAALLDDLNQVYRSGEHLIRLVNDLLDLSCAEIGELELWPETIDTHGFLSEVFASVAPAQDAEPGLVYQLALAPGLPLIHADPVRLRQILLNLLGNAGKFTPAGRVVLGAEVAPPCLHLWVQDTGPGIPEELQKRMFEPFVTGDIPAPRRRGVGLGLSITRRLVALHGGTMTVDSRSGVGSTFHVFLPLPTIDGQLPSEQPAGRPVILLLASHGNLPPAIAELSRRQGLAIERLGHGSDLAALDGTQPVLAWDLASAAPADWLLLRKLRADPRLARVPLLLYGQHDSSRIQIGATGLLGKPLHGPALLDALSVIHNAEAIGPVLIADDDAAARDLYSGLVREALPGVAILQAGGGAAALAIVEQDVPSLVLLDLAMPDVDGFEVLERLRADPRTCHVPVLILSGRTLDLEAVERIDHALVTFHSKHVLSDAEAVAAVTAAVSGAPALAQPTSRIVKQVLAYIQLHHPRQLSRGELAEAVGVSPNYLTHIFRHELGMSPWDYLNRYRIQRAKTLLRETRASITDVAGSVGFADVSYFGRVFRKQVGCSPLAYRERRPSG